METIKRRMIPAWLGWSLVTIVLGGAWGLLSKVASARINAGVNQLLLTAGQTPLMVFAAFTVRRHNAHEPREDRGMGAFWAFLTGILGGVGNMFFFQAMVVGGKASVVSPVTVALHPVITVLLAFIFLHERLGRAQWLGVVLAFISIYLVIA